MISNCLVPRSITAHLAEAMGDTPVVLVAGPRQAGKTTLVRHWAHTAGAGMRYLTLDDESVRTAAREDPVGLVRSVDRAVIDEIQRAPEVLLAIKKSVDEDRRPGRFLLTGSANLMALPTVSESLAGRMETLTLLPLSQSEMAGQSANWLDEVFAGRIPQAAAADRSSDLVERVLIGGYPEVLTRSTERRRSAWMRQYLDALIQRDVREVLNIDRLDQVPRFLRALSHTAGQMCNYSQLGAQVGLDGKTASRHIGVLEQMYLLRRIEPWARNRLSRLVKSPKLQFIDSGLLASLQGLTSAEVIRDRRRLGPVLESFVFGELLKHAAAAEGEYRILYYRDADQVEVDLVLEDAAGGVVGVEIKASATVREGDLRGLRKLAHLSGSSFRLGVLLYDGAEILPMGEGLWAAPIASLWGR